MDVILIGVITLIFLNVFLRVYKKDIVFGMVILWMFLYCIFTIIGYLFYPQKLILHSGGQYYGKDIFYHFYLYIIGFFLMVGFLFGFFDKIRSSIEVKTVYKKVEFSRLVFYFIIISYIFIMTFFLLKYYEQLSYVNQIILKSNKIWIYSYSISTIFIVALIDDFKKNTRSLSKVFNALLLSMIIVVVIITSLKSGQRIQLFMISNSIIVYFIVELGSDIKNNFKYRIRDICLSQKIKFGIGLLILILFFQIIRSTRGNISNIKDLEFKTLITSLFSLESLVFQDWLIPSLSLLSVMYYKIIAPVEVIKSNALNIFSFIAGGYPSLGEIFSRQIDPNGMRGYGYYFLTEGYQLAGYLGFIVSSFLIVFYYRCYRVLFISTNNKNYNSYISSIFSMYIISLVRGQSLFFIKGIILYIIPAIILFFLKDGVLPKLYKKNS